MANVSVSWLEITLLLIVEILCDASSVNTPAIKPSSGPAGHGTGAGKALTHAVLAWLGENRLTVELDVIEKAFRIEFAMRPGDITVVRHFLEDFFIIFTHRPPPPLRCGSRPQELMSDGFVVTGHSI